jgi:hypothetical protein
MRVGGKDRGGGNGDRRGGGGRRGDGPRGGGEGLRMGGGGGEGSSGQSAVPPMYVHSASTVVISVGQPTIASVTPSPELRFVDEHPMRFHMGANARGDTRSLLSLITNCNDSAVETFSRPLREVSKGFSWI